MDRGFGRQPQDVARARGSAKSGSNAFRLPINNVLLLLGVPSPVSEPELIAVSVATSTNDSHSPPFRGTKAPIKLAIELILIPGFRDSCPHSGDNALRNESEKNPALVRF